MNTFWFLHMLLSAYKQISIPTYQHIRILTYLDSYISWDLHMNTFWFLHISISAYKQISIPAYPGISIWTRSDSCISVYPYTNISRFLHMYTCEYACITMRTYAHIHICTQEGYFICSYQQMSFLLCPCTILSYEESKNVGLDCKEWKLRIERGTWYGILWGK
jgi:hypothetical protein